MVQFLKKEYFVSAVLFTLGSNLAYTSYAILPDHKLLFFSCSAGKPLVQFFHIRAHSCQAHVTRSLPILAFLSHLLDPVLTLTNVLVALSTLVEI